jgi:hypothetical protein
MGSGIFFTACPVKYCFAVEASPLFHWAWRRFEVKRVNLLIINRSEKYRIVTDCIYFAHSGIVEGSISSTNPRTSIPSVRITTPRRLIKNPTFTISIIRIRLVPKIMALGGVATGIMKAKELARVAGIINRRGFLPMAVATAARIGSIISAVAVFDVSSVRKVIMKQMLPINTPGERV